MCRNASLLRYRYRFVPTALETDSPYHDNCPSADLLVFSLRGLIFRLSNLRKLALFVVYGVATAHHSILRGCYRLDSLSTCSYSAQPRTTHGYSHTSRSNPSSPS